MSQETKLFTREELKCRNKREDAILIIHNGVYDVTHFLDEHPGGEEVLMDLAGKDASEPFEDVSHSSDARLGLYGPETGTPAPVKNQSTENRSLCTLCFGGGTFNTADEQVQDRRAGGGGPSRRQARVRAALDQRHAHREQVRNRLGRHSLPHRITVTTRCHPSPHAVTRHHTA